LRGTKTCVPPVVDVLRALLREHDEVREGRAPDLADRRVRAGHDRNGQDARIGRTQLQLTSGAVPELAVKSAVDVQDDVVGMALQRERASFAHRVVPQRLHGGQALLRRGRRRPHHRRVSAHGVVDARQ
jgi:hypothetical protein